MLIGFGRHTWPVIGGGGSEPALVGSATRTLFPHNATEPLTVDHSFSSTGNVAVVRVSWESGGTTLDTSVDVGGGNLPTLNGVTMNTHGIANATRRHSCIFTVQPDATGTLTFSFNPSAGVRGGVIQVEEWTNVDTTTPVNVVGANNAGATSLAVTMTTVDADGWIVGVCTNDSETEVVTTSVGTQEATVASGVAAQDITATFSNIAVASAAATEGITWDFTSSAASCGSIVELNPA